MFEKDIEKSLLGYLDYTRRQLSDEAVNGKAIMEEILGAQIEVMEARRICSYLFCMRECDEIVFNVFFFLMFVDKNNCT